MDQPHVHPVAQPYAQPQFVVMPVAQRNALGTFGFLVALVGLFVPTGVVALLGLSLSLAAIGRSPRGMAAMGVILGLLGTVFWLVVMGVLLVVGAVGALAIAAATAVGFAITNPEVIEVSSDMVNVAMAVEDYAQRNDDRPVHLSDLALGVAATTDPWGGTYRLVAAEEGSELNLPFDVVSGGPDGTFDTSDDIRLSRLDVLWKQAFETFEDRMEELEHRMQALQRTCESSACGEGPALQRRSSYEAYEQKARHLMDRLEDIRREAHEAHETHEVDADR